jgi:hypothetical protein
MAMVTVEVQESWYGVSEAHGKDTWLWVQLGPDTLMPGKPGPERKLVIKGLRLPVHGVMVVGTTRRARVSDKRLLTAPKPPGKPELAVRMSYDPRGDHGPDHLGRLWAWEGNLSGVSYPVRLVTVKRRTVWDRL